MNHRFIKYLKSAATLFIAFALSIVFFFLIFRIDGIKNFIGTIITILMPFIYGAVIAYILRPVCNFIEEFLLRLPDNITGNTVFKAVLNPFCVLVSILLGLIVFYMFFAMVIPQIVDCITTLIKNAPDYMKSIQRWFEENLRNNDVLKNYAKDITEYLNSFINDKIQNDVMPNIQAIIGGVSSGVVSLIAVFYNIFMGTVFAVYLLAGRKKLAFQAKLIFNGVVGEKYCESIMEEIKYADRAFSSFINGKLLASLIIGVICFIFTAATNMPYGMLISVIIAFTNMIPFFGPFIGDIPSLLLVVLVSPIKAFYLLVFLIVLQQFEGNILTPKILGNSIGLSGLWILFSIVLFGGLFGFMGMIVGIPLFAVIYDIVKRLVHKCLDKNNKAFMIDEYNKVFHGEKENEKDY